MDAFQSLAMEVFAMRTMLASLEKSEWACGSVLTTGQKSDLSTAVSNLDTALDGIWTELESKAEALGFKPWLDSQSENFTEAAVKSGKLHELESLAKLVSRTKSRALDYFGELDLGENTIETKLGSVSSAAASIVSVANAAKA